MILSHRGLSILYWKLLLHLFSIVENSLFLELWLLVAKMVLHIYWCGNCHHWCKQSCASSTACYYLLVRWWQHSFTFEDNKSSIYQKMWLKRLVSVNWGLKNWSNFIHKHVCCTQSFSMFSKDRVSVHSFRFEIYFLLYLVGTSKYQTIGLCPNLLDTLSFFMHTKTFYSWPNMKISCFKLNKLKLFHSDFTNLVSSILLNVSGINFCISIHSKSFICFSSLLRWAGLNWQCDWTNDMIICVNC